MRLVLGVVVFDIIGGSGQVHLAALKFDVIDPGQI